MNVPPNCCGGIGDDWMSDFWFPPITLWLNEFQRDLCHVMSTAPPLRMPCYTPPPTASLSSTAPGRRSRVIDKCAAHESVLSASDAHYIAALNLPTWAHILMEHSRAFEQSSNIVKSEWNPIYYDDSQRKRQLGTGLIAAEYRSAFECDPISKARYEMQSFSACEVVESHL